MATVTTNYNLKKPSPTDYYRISDFNDNMDIIDGVLVTKAALNSPALTGIPTAPTAAADTATTQLATTEFVINQLETLSGGATVAELAGPGWTTETVKGNADNILSLQTLTIILSVGWYRIAATVARVNNNAISIASNQFGSMIQVGDKIQLANGGLKYFYVTDVPTYSSGVHTVPVSGGTDYVVSSDPITDLLISHAANPIGFPAAFNYTPSYLGWAATPTIACNFSIQGRIVRYKFHINGNSNWTGVEIGLPVTAARAGTETYIAAATLGYASSQGAALSGAAKAQILGTTPTKINIYSNMASGAWLNDGLGKMVGGTIHYPI
jgi:hypothetical protein